MDHGLLDILTCPSCKSELNFSAKEQLLICKADRLAFEVREGKPIMLSGEAQPVSDQQIKEILGKQ